jgi:rod shape-determining protein MreB
MERGIMLAGGGSLLLGLDVAVEAETGMPVRRAKNALYAVVLGSGQCLEQFDVLRQVLISGPDD